MQNVSGGGAAAFAGRRILVTGHTGFKGSWLAAWLKALGAQVSGVALEPSGDPSLFAAAGIGAGLDSRLGDIRDAHFLADTFRDIRPEFVFHLAAQSLVRESYTDPVGTYATNVMGTVNLLEAVRGCNSVRGVLVVTSDKCYENREWLWGYRETDAMGGHDPYSASKGCTEIVAASYRRAFFQDAAAPLLATARAGNVIGGGDWATDRLLPDLMRGAAAGSTVRVRNPQAIRPWQHVLDGLGGYLLLAGRLLGGDRTCAEAWNFGPAEHDVVSVGRVVSQACAHWDAISVAYSEQRGDEPHEANVLRLDSGKARSRLGWRPVFELDEAIDRTVAWYRGYYTGQSSARRLLDSQIAEYQGRFE